MCVWQLIEEKLAEIAKQQQEIAELKVRTERYQNLVCQTCDGHGMVGNILDSMDCPDCLAYENRIKADAIGDAMQKFRYDFEGPRDTDSIEAFFDEIEKELREQK